MLQYLRPISRISWRNVVGIPRQRGASTAVAGAVWGDDRNKDVLIYLNRDGNGQFVRREEAVVSVFDSGFLLGDGIWEGLRLYNSKWFCLEQHLRRLYEAAKFMDIDISLSPAQLTQDLNELVSRNGMKSGVHARLMVTRGEKYTPYQGPVVNIGPPTIVCIAEHKKPAPANHAIDLFTVSTRRGYADSQEQKLNSHSKINCVTACIAAAKAGANEALMLDPHGQVATCNSTHFFIVRGGEVWTSRGAYCIPGITRQNILDLCRANGVTAVEKDFSLYDVYAAEEAFVTGTFSGVVPVRSVDGRMIGTDLYDTWRQEVTLPGRITSSIQGWYLNMVDEHCGQEEH